MPWEQLSGRIQGLYRFLVRAMVPPGHVIREENMNIDEEIYNRLYREPLFLVTTKEIPRLTERRISAILEVGELILNPKYSDRLMDTANTMYYSKT